MMIFKRIQKKNSIFGIKEQLNSRYFKCVYLFKRHKNMVFVWENV